MATIKIPLKELEYERLKTVLEDLKCLAEMADAYGYEINAMPRNYTQEIIDILLELEI